MCLFIAAAPTQTSFVDRFHRRAARSGPDGQDFDTDTLGNLREGQQLVGHGVFLRFSYPEDTSGYSASL